MDAQARIFRDKAEELRVVAESCRSGSASQDFRKIAAQYDELACVLEWRAQAERAEAAQFYRH